MGRHLTRLAPALMCCALLVGCTTAGRTGGSSGQPKSVPVVSTAPADLLDDGRYAYAFIDTDDKVLDAGVARCTNEPGPAGEPG